MLLKAWVKPFWLKPSCLSWIMSSTKQNPQNMQPLPKGHWFVAEQIWIPQIHLFVLWSGCIQRNLLPETHKLMLQEKKYCSRWQRKERWNVRVVAGYQYLTGQSESVWRLLRRSIRKGTESLVCLGVGFIKLAAYSCPRYGGRPENSEKCRVPSFFRNVSSSLWTWSATENSAVLTCHTPSVTD